MFDLELEEDDILLLLALLAFGMRVYGITSGNTAKLKAIREKLEKEAQRRDIPVDEPKETK